MRKFAPRIAQRNFLGKQRRVVAANDNPTKKMLNLQTYKYHSLDDYARTIRQLGTTDSYSTTTVRTVNTLYDFDC
jgi:hypothetical protein